MTTDFTITLYPPYVGVIVWLVLVMDAELLVLVDDFGLAVYDSKVARIFLTNLDSPLAKTTDVSFSSGSVNTGSVGTDFWCTIFPTVIV